MDMEFLVPIAIFGVIGFVIKTLSDNNVRKHLIDKGVSGEDAGKILPSVLEGSLPSSLKWGMVLIAIGLSFFIGELVPARDQELVTAAVMFISAGTGLLVYYAIGSKMLKDKGE